MIWQRYPVFRVFLFFCAGIILANFTNTSFLYSLLGLVLALVLMFLLAVFTQILSTYKTAWVFGLTSGLVFFFLGVVCCHLYSERFSKKFYANKGEFKKSYLVQLLDDPQEKENSYGCRARVLANHDSSGTQLKEANIMVYFQKSKLVKELSYGDEVLISARLSELRSPMNPYEFDYKDYLNLKAIYYQAYTDSLHWQKVLDYNKFGFIKFSKEARTHLLEVIDTWHLNKDQESVTKALLLGYRYDIKDDLMKAYSSAGAMHVLAVSGLHVGIVYLMAFYLLYFLDKVKYGAVIRTVILVLLLWSYAFLTGLSASVVRAATMFTFVALGTGLKRYTSVYNTILGSAIILLLWKPTYLFEVGFQLSYAAVFGIVWLQPKMQSLWSPSNWLVKQFWGITTVSIAAQLMTFPLGIYYFHQFPALFLISNWMVIPLVTVLMYLGLLTLILSSLGWVPYLMVKIYSFLLGAMNHGVEFVESFKDFLIQQIHVTRFELVLLYAIIFLAISWIIRGGYSKLLASVSLVVIFSLSQLSEAINHNSQKQVIVYAVKDQLALGLYVKGQGVLICDSSLWEDDESLTFHIKHHWWARDLELISQIDKGGSIVNSWFSKKENIIGFENDSYCIYKPNLCPANSVWVIDGNTWPGKDETVVPTIIVLSASPSYNTTSKWQEWANKKGVDVWSTKSSGAFVMNYNSSSIF